MKTKLILIFLVSLMQISCGGGSSNSGGEQVQTPSVPTAPLFVVGLYSGTIDFIIEGENVIDLQEEPSPFTLEVIGNLAGGQQVRVAFREFSGTSLIGEMGGFSIPSGSFRIPVRDDSGRDITICTGAIQFDGTFSNTVATGEVSTQAPFVCNDSDFGPITLTAAFEATFGASKRGGLSDDVSVQALK